MCPDDWWSEVGNIPKMGIDYSIRYTTTKEKSKEIITQCLEHIISDLKN